MPVNQETMSVTNCSKCCVAATSVSWQNTEKRLSETTDRLDKLLSPRLRRLAV